MSLEDFQLKDKEPIDNSIVNRQYLKIYHQQGALLNDPDQGVEFMFVENNKYHQFGNSQLGFDITERKANGKNFISLMTLLQTKYHDWRKTHLLFALRKEPY